ncbi:female sterile (1) Nasrat isoform X2 [Amblyomma americanum]
MLIFLAKPRPRPSMMNGLQAWLLWIILIRTCDCAAPTALPAALESRLSQAALQVIKSHTPYPGSGAVPLFLSDEHLMHSNIRTKSSIGDREELQVTKLMLSGVKTDVYGAVRWTHLRHNHSDHVMAVTQNNVHLWRFTSPNADLLAHNAMFRFSSGSDDIVDATAFLRNEKNFQSMFLVLIIRTGPAAKLVAYEVDAAGESLLYTLQLTEVPIKVRWLQSQREGTLVLLFPSAYADVGFTDIRQGGTVLSHVVKVHVPMAVAMETTTISGYGYVAVSNATSVLVYRSDDLASNFKVFDVLHGSELTDVSVFRVGFDNVLAVAGQREQFLYVWRGGGFFLRQVLKVPRAFQWHPVTVDSCRDDVILGLATMDTAYPLRLLTWSSRLRRFQEVDRGTVPLGGFVVLKDSLSSFSIKDNAWMFFTDATKGTPKSIMVSTKVVMLSNPVQEKGSQLVLRMSMLKDQLDKQQALLGQASNTLRHAVSTKAPVNVVQVKQVVRSILVNGPVSMGFAKLPQGLTMEGSKVSMNELHSRMPELHKAISDIGFRIRKLVSALKDAVFKSQPATITAPKVVQGHFSTPLVKASEANIASFHGVPVADLFRNLYWMNKPTTITGKITLTTPARVRSSLQTPSVNGINLADAVTTDRHHTISGPTTFASPLMITKDSLLEGRLNGLKLSDLVTLTGTHYITAPKNITSVQVLQELSAQMVDSVDLVAVAASTMNSVDVQTAEGSLTFARNVQVASVSTPLVNGIKVADIGSRFVTVNRPAVITGAKNFVAVFEALHDIHLRGRLNKLSIPHDLMLKDAEQFVQGPKQFSRLITSVTNVEGRVSGVSLPADVYRLTDDGPIDVPLAFANGFQAQRDVHVAGTVDNIDISEFAAYASKQPAKVVKNNVVFKAPVFVKKSVRVFAKVNSVLLDALYKDAIFPTNESTLVMTGQKTFHNGAKVAQMTVKGSVNGYNLLEDFVATEDHQDIHGIKTFTGPAVFEKNLNSNTGIIDGVPLSKLFAGRITLHSEQNITAEPLFLNTVRVKHLYVSGTVQGLSMPRDFVLKSVPQKIYGTKHMAHGMSAALLDSRIHATIRGLVGGVDIVDVNRRRIPLSTGQVLSGEFAIGNVTMPFLNAVWMNGRPAQPFLKNVMSKTKPQVVNAPKVFSGVLKAVAPVTTVKGVNGVRLGELNSVAVTLRGQSVVSAPVALRDQFEVMGTMSVHGTLDGRDLRAFEADAVPKRGWATVSGNCVFYRGLSVRGNIAADTVNDLMFSYDVLLKSTDQSIKGHYNFMRDVKVLGDLPHLGHINGVDLSVLDTLIAKEDHENVIQSDLEFNEVIEIGTDLNVQGLFNGHKLRHLRDQAICSAGHHEFTATMIIRGPVNLFNSIEVRHFENGSLSAFLEDIVFIDGHFTTAPKIFSDVLLEGTVKTSHAHFEQLVNGVPIKTVLSDAVWGNGKCELFGENVFSDSFTVQKDLTVHGFLNGLLIPNDLIQLCHNKACPEQHMDSPVFQDVQVPGHLPVSSMVNGHFLPHVLEDTLFVSTNQTVHGTKHLEVVTFEKNVLPERVNGKLFRQEVVTLHTAQTLHVKLSYTHVVTPNVVVKGLINNFNFLSLVRHAVLLNVPQTIAAPLTLNNVVVRQNIQHVGTLNNLRLEQLARDVSHFEHAAAQLSRSLGQRIAKHEEALNELSCFLTGSYSAVDYFVLHQYLDVEATTVDTAPGVGLLRLVDAHDGDALAQAFYFAWSRHESLWRLQGAVSADEGERVYFSLEGRLLWLELPLADSNAGRAMLTDGMTVLFNFGDVLSMSAVAKTSHTAILASLTKNGVLDLFIYTMKNFEPALIGTVNPGEGATSVKLVALEGAVYAVASVFDHRACITEHHHSKVYAMEGPHNWRLVQTLYGSAVVNSFASHGFLYALFIGVDMASRCSESSLVKVYRTCGKAGSTFELFQIIPLVSVSKVELVQYGAQSDVFMAAANRTSIQIYTFKGESGFQFHSTLPVRLVTDIKMTVLEGSLYLIVAQGHSTGKSLIYRAVTQGATATFRRLPAT